MLSTQNANRIADDIMQQARLDKLSQLTQVVPSLPLLCRFREMRSLPQQVQQAVVRQATADVLRTPAYIVSLLLSILMLGVVWWSALGATFEAKAIIPLSVLAIAIPVLLRALLVRYRARAIAAQIHVLGLESKPGQAS